TLTSKRLIIRYGIYGFFSHREIPIEIFKIIEVDISSPLIYRFFGVSNLLLRTMEVEHVSLSLLALPQATRLATMLRDLAIQAQIETGNRPIWRIGTGGHFE
ncbi:MAG: PH domain-containing protein, partial [Pseudanabaena sp.]